MRSYLWPIALLFFFVGSPGILIWAIRRWWRASPRIGVPAWRSCLSIGAIVLVGFSGLLWIASFTWIYAGAGYDNAVLMWLFKLGFLAAPIGLLASLIGKGILRWPACVVSVLTMLLWIFTTPWGM